MVLVKWSFQDTVEVVCPWQFKPKRFHEISKERKDHAGLIRRVPDSWGVESPKVTYAGGMLFNNGVWRKKKREKKKRKVTTDTIVSLSEILS